MHSGKPFANKDYTLTMNARGLQNQGSVKSSRREVLTRKGSKMLRMPMKAWVFPCLLCFSLCLRATTADTCVGFTFPTTEVKLDANSSLREVRFEVVNPCNEPLGDYGLEITPSEGKVLEPKRSDNDLCIIRSDVNTKTCGCENKEKGLLCYARDTFTRQPHRTWKLDINVNGVTTTKTQYFNVLYPANLTKFYISNEGSATVTMEEGHTAQFKCHGDWGNPSSTILLRGPQNNIMDSKVFGPSSSSHLVFSKTRLSCSDSGQYRCEVNGTDQHRAVTLLVKCRLEFKERGSNKPVTVKPGGEASVSFHATTYTMDISPCWLTPPAGEKVACNSSESHVTVSGSLPDVVITVKLTGVTEKGTWMLTASNPNGFDTAPFHLSVPDPTTTIPTTPTPPSSETTTSQSSSAGSGAPTVLSPSAPDQSQESRTKWIIIGIACAVVLLIIVVILLVLCIRRRKTNYEPKKRVSPNRRQVQPQEGASRVQENEMIVNSLYDTSDPQCEMITNELYGMSGGMPSAPSADGGAIYELADETRGATTSAHPCRPHAAEDGGVYVDQQEIQRNKARNKGKAKKGDIQPEEGGVYVDQQEIQRNKARNKAKAKEGDSQPEEGGVYVDQQEIQRNKARNKAKAKKGDSQPGLNPGDSEGVYGNA